MPGKYSDGKALNFVAPAGGVLAGRLYRVAGWNHIALVDALVGETYVGEVDPAANYRIPVPAGLAGAVGDVYYFPPASPQVGSTALTATATANVIAVKVTEAKDGNNIMGVRVLNVA